MSDVAESFNVIQIPTVQKLLKPWILISWYKGGQLMMLNRFKVGKGWISSVPGG